MKTKREIDEIAKQVMQVSKDQGMVNNPDSWPLWPYLCMKHRTEKQDGNFPVLGVHYANHDKGYIIYLGSLHEMNPDMPKRVYQTAQELLADWMVD